MTGKVREPFAYSAEPDGSVLVAAFPHSSRAKNSVFRQVGWIRAAPDGSVLSSTTFEEMQDYSMWVVHPSVEEAISSLTVGLINIASNPGAPGERARVSDLRKSLSLIPRFSFRAREALARSARHALLAAVTNMMRVSTYEAVMKTVSDALVADVIES